MKTPPKTSPWRDLRLHGIALSLCLLLAATLHAQGPTDSTATTSRALRPSIQGGMLGLGMRNSVNFFGSDGMLGMGAGGQFKLSFSRHVNTDWFVDLIHSRGDEGVYRRDYHIGWAVQFALNKEGFRSRGVVPYVLGGQCFDLSQVGFTGQYESPLVFTAAAQAGLGLSHFITPHLELNLQSHYMMHLGKHVHPAFDGNGIGHVEVENGFDLSGHVLTTFSFTAYFVRLWNR
jgi:hypothetical protein